MLYSMLFMVIMKAQVQFVGTEINWTSAKLLCGSTENFFVFFFFRFNSIVFMLKQITTNSYLKALFNIR